MRTRLYVAVLLLLSCALSVLIIRGDHDRIPPSVPLAQFPQTLGSWTSTDIPVPDETLAVLGKGVFLNRMYQDMASPVNVADRSPMEGIGLFIGYFPTQRTGQSIHSPQNCLPGSGWTFVTSGRTDLDQPGHKPERVGQYIISDGMHEAVVLYWYQSQGQAIASDYVAKARLLMDSIRYGRTDAALVRVTTFVQPGESRAHAEARAHQFAEKIAPLLPAYIPN